MDTDLDLKDLAKRLLAEYSTYKMSYGEVETETILTMPSTTIN